MSAMDVALDRAGEQFFMPPSDFAVLDLSISPRPPIAGKTVTVTATAENRGSYGTTELPVIVVPEGESAQTVAEMSWTLESGETGTDTAEFTMFSKTIAIQVGNKTLMDVTPQEPAEPPPEDGTDGVAGLPLSPRQLALGAGAVGVGAIGWVALQRSGR